MMAYASWAFASVAIAAAAVASVTNAAQSSQPASVKTVWDGVYSTEQAARGRKLYEASCGYCHRDNLEGGGDGPALVGSTFALRWRDQTLADLFTTIQGTMPKDDPSTLSHETYADIMTYLLQVNGVPPGSHDLPADVHKLAQITYSTKPKEPLR